MSVESKERKGGQYCLVCACESNPGRGRGLRAQMGTSATAPKHRLLGSPVPLLQPCEPGAVCSEQSAFSGTVLQRREPTG